MLLEVNTVLANRLPSPMSHRPSQKSILGSNLPIRPSTMASHMPSQSAGEYHRVIPVRGPGIGLAARQ
ncbi:hypothetical protein DdX_17430 [Ditylenchus destructor]|uniref:Uncharacterized protein n=1 Tax=Ditylenchus destructor TaxID=166010 RepID=A0AAD4MMM6_9BILA|nr:hypothetical protein DdX_17430 [Ditylenchus destructor]